MDRVRSEGGLQRRFTEAYTGRLRMGAIDSYPMGVGDLTVRSIRVLPFTMGEKKWGHGQIH